MALIQGVPTGAHADVGTTSKGVFIEQGLDRIEGFYERVSGKPISLGETRSVVTLWTIQTPSTSETRVTFVLNRNYDLRPVGVNLNEYTPRPNMRFVCLGATAISRNGTAAVHGTTVRLRVRQQQAPGTTTITEAPPLLVFGCGTWGATINQSATTTACLTPGHPGLFTLIHPNYMIMTMIGVAAADTEVSVWGFEY